MEFQVDYHSHLMPGVDDGSRGAVDTIRMARGLLDLGVQRAYLTPHQFRFGNEFGIQELAERTAGVRDLLADAGVPLEVEPGAEYWFSDRLLRAVERDEPLATFWCGGESCVLIEVPGRKPIIGLTQLGRALLSRGIRPVLAHPERYRHCNGGFDRLQRWLEAGWWFQLSVQSLAGRDGTQVEDRARQLLWQGAYACLGSDLHRPGGLRHVGEAVRLLKNLRVTESAS